MLTKRLASVAVLALILSSCSSAGPQEAEIEMIETAPMEDGTFTATGAAVDDGIICAQGIARLVGATDAETGEPASETSTVVLVDTAFVCGDGSGEFHLAVEVSSTLDDWLPAIESGELFDDGEWTVSQTTGDYAKLTGNGARAWQVMEAGVAPWDGGSIRSVYTGVFEAS